MGFLASSANKESTCNAGDPGSIPGLEKGEGIGYPLKYSWASLVVQMEKNPPAVRETCIQSLGQEDPLEESMATHSNIPAWKILMDRGAGNPPGVAKSRPQRSDSAQYKKVITQLMIGIDKPLCCWSVRACVRACECERVLAHGHAHIVEHTCFIFQQTLDGLWSL